MTESTTHLRRQIGSAADLQSVVRAMKAQAAASVGQYAQSVAALGDYARTVELGLTACFRQQASSTGPAAAPTRSGHGQRPIRAVVFGSDQGLVGRFNDKVASFARVTLLDKHPGAEVWAVGERVSASLVAAGVQPQGSFRVPATVQAITGLVSELLVALVDNAPNQAEPGEGFEMHLFYNRPAAGSAYVPVGQQLLPLDAHWRRGMAARPWPTALPPETLGPRTVTLRGLIREFVFVSIFRASAESLASENASRLAAMDRADRNIDRLLQGLNERFHRLRQSRIDEELSDVIAGFKARRPSLAV